MAINFYLLTVLTMIGIAVGNDNCTQSIDLGSVVVNCSVYENIPDGTLIFNASSFFNEDSSYHLISSDMDAFNQYFSYYSEGTSSIFVLQSRGDFDREQMFSALSDPSETGSMVTWTVALIVNPGIRIYILHIHIIDENDNVPVFPNNVTERVVEVMDSFIPTSPISRYLLPAVDEDEKRNAIQGYTLLDDYNGLFQLVESSSSKIVHLQSTQGLDHETRDNYAFQVVARDGGNQTGVLNILWIVEDVNDNFPTVPESIYSVMIQESGSTQLVIYINATDEDSGSNGEITYMMTANTGVHPVTSLFVIDSITGEIRTTGEIDREKASQYHLTVTMKDGGSPSNQVTITVNVSVADINDNAPEVTVNLNELTEGKVREDFEVGRIVGTVTISDSDEGDNSRITNPILVDSDMPNEPPTTFILQARSQQQSNIWDLVLSQPLDREMREEYNLVVIVSDHGMPALTTNQTIYFGVFNINDSTSISSTSILPSVISNSSSTTPINKVLSPTATISTFHGEIASGTSTGSTSSEVLSPTITPRSLDGSSTVLVMITSISATAVMLFVFFGFCAYKLKIKLSKDNTASEIYQLPVITPVHETIYSKIGRDRPSTCESLGGIDDTEYIEMTQPPTVDDNDEEESVTNEEMLDYISGCKVKHSDGNVFMDDTVPDDGRSNNYTSHTSSVGQYMSEQNVVIDVVRGSDPVTTDDDHTVSQSPHINNTSYNDSIQYVHAC